MYFTHVAGQTKIKLLIPLNLDGGSGHLIAPRGMRFRTRTTRYGQCQGDHAPGTEGHPLDAHAGHAITTLGSRESLGVTYVPATLALVLIYALTETASHALTTPEILSSALEALRTFLEYTGTVAFAISGAVAAGRKRMDLVGAVALACMVAVGGGTLRDLLLDVPIFWIEQPSYLLVGAGVGLAVAIMARWHPLDRLDRYRTVLISDAIGLAVFVVVGAGVATAAGTSLVAAAVMGVVTGVGGGVIRDLLANDVPAVLRNGQFYATAALAGGILYAVLAAFDAPSTLTLWLPMLVVLGLRLASLRFKWGVPTIGGKPVDLDRH